MKRISILRTLYYSLGRQYRALGVFTKQLDYTGNQYSRLHLIAVIETKHERVAVLSDAILSLLEDC